MAVRMAGTMQATKLEIGTARRAAGLYLHVPFCRVKCHYCDFNTYAGIEDLIPAYVDALARDMERSAAGTDRRDRHMVSVFFGGGTPSLLSGGQVGRLLETAARCWDVPASAEVTLEANPGTLAPEALTDLRAAGVNRLSFGVQSFQTRGLTALGREHSVADVYQAVEGARRAGIENVNLDLIYGWPEQRPDEWEDDLARVANLAVPHLSLYPLTVETGTPLATMVRRGRVRVADDDTMAERYELAVERLARAGYTQYEVSNWALATPERPALGEGATPPLACRHNLLYWRNEEYWGGGPGAHSHWAGRRWMTLRSPRRYIERVGAGGDLAAMTETIPPVLARAETMVLGLRLAEGVSVEGFARRHGCSPFAAYGPLLERLLACGQVARLGDRLIVPQRYRYLLDGIVADFLPDDDGEREREPVESRM